MTTYTVTLPDAYDPLNTPARGYLEGVTVALDDGTAYDLTFLDPYNLEHYGFYFEGRNVVVVDDVTSESIRAKVAELLEKGELASMRAGPGPR